MTTDDRPPPLEARSRDPPNAAGWIRTWRSISAHRCGRRLRIRTRPAVGALHAPCAAALRAAPCGQIRRRTGVGELAARACLGDRAPRSGGRPGEAASGAAAWAGGSRLFDRSVAMGTRPHHRSRGGSHRRGVPMPAAAQDRRGRNRRKRRVDSSHAEGRHAARRSDASALGVPRPDLRLGALQPPARRVGAASEPPRESNGARIDHPRLATAVWRPSERPGCFCGDIDSPTRRTSSPTPTTRSGRAFSPGSLEPYERHHADEFVAVTRPEGLAHRSALGARVRRPCGWTRRADTGASAPSGGARLRPGPVAVGPRPHDRSRIGGGR